MAEIENSNLATNSFDGVMEIAFSNTSHFKLDENSAVTNVREGEDYIFLYEKFLNKGSFGHVHNTWMWTPEGHSRIVVKKTGDHYSRQQWRIGEEQIRGYFELQKAPYLLIPDVFLRSTDGSLNYLIMEKAETSLTAYIKERFELHRSSCLKGRDKGPHYEAPYCNGGLDPQLCSNYFYQIAQGVRYLHAHGYTHGDIKSDNILLMPKLLEVKLADADFIKKEETKRASGTLGFRAPEVGTTAIKNVLKCSDVFSLCCCLPEMLLGYHMECSADESRLAVRNELLEAPMDDVDPQLGYIFKNGMQVDYTLRPTCDEIVEYFQKNLTLKERTDELVNVDAPNKIDSNDPSGISLTRKILESWIEDIMDSLPQSLHPLTSGPYTQD